MKKYIVTSILTMAALLLGSTMAFAKNENAATVVDYAIWAHDLLYGTAATTNGFNSPPEQTVDIIYSFAGSGLMNQRSVSESAPGDMDYNGGRWWVHSVVFTPLGMDIHDSDHDGKVDFELTNAEDVIAHAALGHLTITPTDVYFSCPLRGPGHPVE